MRKRKTNNNLNTSPLGVRISRFVLENGKVRFVIQDSETLQPLMALSIYEAYLSGKYNSHNTVLERIQRLSYLMAWGKQSNIDIEAILLNGEMLKPQQVNAFGAWLNQRGNIRDQNPIEPITINAVLNRTSQAFGWFATQYAHFPGRASERGIQLQMYKESIKEHFSDHHLKVSKNVSADDLTDEEISTIEQFLIPENRLKRFPKLTKAQALRDYLIWRLVIEFGLREGEILALRLEDCPHQHQNYIKIVRIEDRGSDYIDPRGAYAPRPKTLYRELGFLLENSPIKKLMNEYITKYRRRKVLAHGRRTFKYIFDIPAFLILSHKNDTGAPLSLSALLDIAADIREGTGIEHFHWHIGRHSFFNRAYASIMDLKEKDSELYKEKLRDLVYWGGWESEKSLQIYINRARRERALQALNSYHFGAK
jgi:integrase